MLIEKYVPYWQTLIFVTRYNGRASHPGIAQSSAFAASFLTHI
jgi:hypothetical protein